MPLTLVYEIKGTIVSPCAFAWEAGHLLRDVALDVEWIGDDDQDRIRRRLLDLLGDRLHNAGVGVEQIVTGHSRLARDAGRDDHEIGIGGLVVAVRADEPRIEAFDRRRLPLVEPFALRNSFDHVHHDHGARELFLSDALCSRRADVPRADDRNLVDHEYLLFGK